MTTTRSAELRTQIEIVERQRLAAAEAERQRVAAEQQHQQEMAAAEEKLATLKRAEQEAQLDELKAAHSAKVREWEQASRVLWARLESPDIKLSDITPGLLSDVDAAYNTCQHSFESIASSVDQLAYDEATYAQKRDALIARGLSPIQAESRLRDEARNTIGQTMSRLQNALSPQETLIRWITKASNDVSRRQRIAIAYMLTGIFVEPNYGER